MCGKESYWGGGRETPAWGMPAVLKLSNFSGACMTSTLLSAHFLAKSTPSSPLITTVRPITPVYQRPTLHLNYNQPQRLRFQPRLRGLLTKRFYDRRLEHCLHWPRRHRHSSSFLHVQDIGVRTLVIGDPYHLVICCRPNRRAIHTEKRFMRIICKK